MLEKVPGMKVRSNLIVLPRKKSRLFTPFMFSIGLITGLAVGWFIQDRENQKLKRRLEEIYSRWHFEWQKDKD